MIRLAKKSDIFKIKELGQTLVSNFSSTNDIETYINNEKYIVLVNIDKVINSFMLLERNLNDYELEYIIVEDKYRNQGIASNMLEFFIKNYCQKGSAIFLEVNVNNKFAIKLYEKFDFKIINTRKKYYENDDAFVMKRIV